MKSGWQAVKMHDYVSGTVNVTCNSKIAERIHPKLNNIALFVKFPKKILSSDIFSCCFVLVF